nr:MAG: replication associated protein [Cressdnaviricota sp.]
MNRQLRTWFLTINNYSEAEHEKALDYECDYSIVAQEVGEEENVPHIHMYYEFKAGVRFSTLKKAFPRADIEPRKGSAKQAITYCKKQGEYIEKGKAKEQGKRTDLEEVSEMVMEKKTLREICSEHPTTFIKYHRGIEKAMYTMLEKRTEKPTIIWIYGKTGVGKTYMVHDIHGAENIYLKNSTKWWDGYYQQEAILLDDFEPSQWKLQDLLRLLQERQYTAEVKGGMVEVNSPYIYITAQHKPSYYWNIREDLEQIERRISYTFLLQ